MDAPLQGLRSVGPADTSASASPPAHAPLDGSAVEDAVNGAYAVLAVAAGLLRYLVERATHGRHAVVFRLPLTGYRFGLSGVLTDTAWVTVRALAGMADRVVPGVARAVLARLDVPALVREFVDLDRLAAVLDVDAVVARVDLDALAARLDLDAAVERVDIARILDRVDLDALAARLDLDAAVDRVDLDRAVDRVDVDRVLARTDLAGLARYVVQEIDLPGLLRASSGSVSSEMVRSVRDQGADADKAVERVVDRWLHRHGRRAGRADGVTGAPEREAPR